MFMGHLGRPGTLFWPGYLGRPNMKIGPWAGPGPSAKHEARGSLARWHDGPNLARHDRAGPGWAARLLIYIQEASGQSKARAPALQKQTNVPPGLVATAHSGQHTLVMMN